MIERLAEFGDRRPTWGYIIVALGFALALWMEVGLRP